MALKEKWKLRHCLKDKGSHWLDLSKCSDTRFLSDMKIMYAIMWLYVPLPLFWSLFDQQGSKWTFQASRTNGTLWNGVQILPDQMQVVNPAIVLVMIPVFERLVYPYCSFALGSPLRRMVAGGLMAGCAFLASGILELCLEKTYPLVPPKSQAAINVINTLPCRVRINNSLGSKPPRIVEPEGVFIVDKILVKNFTTFHCSLEAVEDGGTRKCGEYELKNSRSVLDVPIWETQTVTALVGITDDGRVFVHVTDPVQHTKSLSGKSRIRYGKYSG